MKAVTGLNVLAALILIALTILVLAGFDGATTVVGLAASFGLIISSIVTNEKRDREQKVIDADREREDQGRR